MVGESILLKRMNPDCLIIPFIITYVNEFADKDKFKKSYVTLLEKLKCNGFVDDYILMLTDYYNENIVPVCIKNIS